jgi:serine protease Do
MKRARARDFLRPIACLMLFALQAEVAQASETWYRWVDAQGTSHLDNQPPGAGISYQLVTVPDSIEWTGRPDMPPAVTDKSNRFVKGLFGQASQSVYPVVIGASGLPETPETVSGSAVAISDSLLLTNCSVTEASGRGLFIGIGGIDKLVRAQLVARDYPSGRCVISVRDARVHPAAGVRRLDTLEFGEPVYAVSDPVKRSLSRGELSGLQVFDRAQYLQTTAAVPPGSSGSGVFDSSGNLIGVITTIWWDSQPVEVAIPAEDFWK